MVGGLIFMVVLIAGITIYMEVRRQASKAMEMVAQEKSDISTLSHMTAHLVTFRTAGKMCILAASDVMGLLFYRVISRSGEVARMQLLLTNIQQVHLFIDGTQQSASFYSTQTTPNLKATEASNAAVADMAATDLENLHSLELRLKYISNNQQEKVLRIPLLHLPSGSPPPQNALGLTRHAIWWHYFLRFAIQDCKKIMPQAK